MSTTTTTYSSTKTSSFAPSSFSAPQRKTMSITQTYFLAHKARAKLSSQAARPDHNLRLLVGHANLLDTLMLELADAEREQESWFNQSVRGANKAQQEQSAPKADRHVQWADTVIEEPEEDWQADADDDNSDASSDASSDYSESDDDEFDDDFEQQSPASSIDEDVLMADAAPLRRVASHKASIETVDEEDAYSTEEEDDEADDDEATHAHLTLTRSPSHSASSLSSSSSVSHISSPPELVIEEDSDVSSEDDESSMPPSPPVVTLQSFDKKAAASLSKAAATTAIKAIVSPQEEEDDAFDDDDSTAHYYLPPRNPARLITALSVY